MKACRIDIRNFRGIKAATLLLPTHGVLIGDNNTGKTTILEALDLVLGPDRLNRKPPIDEHDFFQGNYVIESAATVVNDGGATAAVPAEQALAAANEDAPRIEIEVTVCDLSDEQRAKFGDYVEFWNTATDQFYTEPEPAGVDPTHISEALRITFHGWYDPEEDDFEGETYFTRSLTEEEKSASFTKKHKQVCGFLYLRSIRTGSRALSLERGSLLDIILRLKEVRPQMWEATLLTLGEMEVASDPDLGISPILKSINGALKKYVPKEWGVEPHLKVSNLTREHLRKTITAFIATGNGSHAAPFYRQGTGTINMLVLAMLSLIAEDKQNVIFAMEEPETAIPPYAQKCIIHEVRKLASQTLFTSHSPYVLEEFSIEDTVVLGRDDDGTLARQSITLPANVKAKRYRQEFRIRFCEGLLARRLLIAEGATEASAFPAACRRLSELKPDEYASLESLGICIVDAASESNIPGMGKLYKDLGKRIFAICDKQEAASEALIKAQVEILLMHAEKGFEDLVLKGTTEAALKRFATQVDWPPHLKTKHPNPDADIRKAMSDYFQAFKADGAVAEFLGGCSEDEIPTWIREACKALNAACNPPVAAAVPAPAAQATPPAGTTTNGAN
ncbi:AAA family ATPase [Filomicrobium sp.]|uniref:ATP-dependent nuclease n=1 Tax=Filomicrobium sp. TaxID=2024831 RepID=UPI002584889D|nr:AAA family ATPase [Filomicrobium sp.]MCV0371838.1 AAA family ATPase [Filomicrobium sp.]